MAKKITNADEIIIAADLEQIFRSLGNTLKPEGSHFYTKCPNCSAEPEGRKKKGLYISPKQPLNFLPGAHGLAKCFSCDFHLNTSNFFQAHPHFLLPYREAIEKLATYTHVLPSFQQRKEAIPVASKQKVTGPNFRDQQLAESGLTLEDVTTKEILEDGTKMDVIRYTMGTRDASGNINTDGPDMQLHYFTLNNRRLELRKINSKGEPYGKPIPYTRQRNYNPEDHRDKNQKPMKYKSPYGTGVQPWHTNLLLNKYKRGAEVETLYIVEGEKKADCMAKFGMVAIGIGGITMLANNDILHPDFSQVIGALKVKNVVFVTDGDWDLIKANPNEPVNHRPAQFRSAVMNFEKYFRNLRNINLDVRRYWGYVKHFDGKPEVKGVDDLVVKHLNLDGEKLKSDFEKTINSKNGHGEFINCIEVSEWTPAKFNQYFHVDSIESFFHYYKDQLRNREKTIYGHTEYRWNKDADEFECAFPIEESERFWHYERGKQGRESYKILYHKIDTFFANRGIGRITIQTKPVVQTAWVHAENKQKIVRNINGVYARDFVRDTLHEMQEYGISDFIRNTGKLKDDRLEQLPYLDNQVQLLKHKKHVSYMFFKDLFWIITKEGIAERQPHEIEGYIWESQVIDRKPQLLKEKILRFTKDNRGKWDLFQSESFKKCHFANYLFNTGLSNKKPFDTLSVEGMDDVLQNFVNKVTALGYLIFRYFDPGCAKGIFAIDALRPGQDEDQASGRSGKSLFGEALVQLVNVVKMDGKAADFDNDKFRFGRITAETDVAFIDDMQKGSKYDPFYNAIVGNLQARALHKQEVTIPKELTPKFFFTTNYDIHGLLKNDSTMDRVHIMVFGDWYNKDYRPSDEFGCLFFDEWEEDQWNLFYNFAAECVQMYMLHGLVPAAEGQVRNKMLFHDINPTFKAWADEFYLTVNDSGKRTYEKFLIQGDPDERNKLVKSSLHETFLEYARKSNPRFTMNVTTFKTNIRSWGEYYGFILNPGKKWTKGGREYPDGGQWSASGTEYIVFGLNPEQIKNIQLG